MKTVLCIDGNSILNRNFYGIRPLTTVEGLHTNAVYGFLNTLFRQCEVLEPDAVIVAFDRREKTFRHEAYAEYKAGRRPMPEELAEQFPYAKNCIEALGFRCCEVVGYEADDILGTFSRLSEEAGAHCYLLTGDRDALQLISDNTTVLLATNKETVPYDPARFFADYGVTPTQYIDVKALMGDSSDHIIGVPGIGEKTAFRLIADYRSLDGVYEELEEKDIPKGQKEKLAAGKESAYQSRFLATIVRDCPLPFSLADAKKTAYDVPGLRALLEKLEFSAFLKKLDLGAAVLPEKEKKETVSKDASAYFAEHMSGLIALWIDEEDAVYVSDTDETPASLGAFADCAAVLAAQSARLIVYDAKALYHRFDRCGIRVRCAAFDCMTAAYVLTAADGHFDAERIALQYLGTSLSQDGGSRAAALAALYPVLTEKMEREGSENLYKTVELPLSAVLCDMEEAGFRIDTAGLADFGEKLAALCDTFAERVWFAAGHRFNLNSPKQLGEVLFEELGLPAPKKTKTGYSTSAEVLEKLRYQSDIVSDVLEYRQVAKLRSTYAEGLLKVADESGRIHTSFNQTVTATGRLSSAEPNLQNIPIRTELGRELRRFFVADGKDRVLVDADYSQIELRLLAAISGDERLTEAFRNGEDIHTITASEVFGTPQELVTKEERKRAKAVNFGIVYGIGDYSLGLDLGVSRKQAGEYIRSYLETYPGVERYQHETIEKGRRDGYVETMLGRRRYIREFADSKKAVQAFGDRVAMNSPIQGTAADIIKLAMIRIDRMLREEKLDAKLILQVHDELIVECSTACCARVRELLRDAMENAVELTAPLTVDVQSGENWYEGH